ncbi:MAG: hypothetical protein RSC14_06715 [Niameybacter sp.]
MIIDFKAQEATLFSVSPLMKHKTERKVASCMWQGYTHDVGVLNF